MACPVLCQSNDAMNVIGHCYEGIQFNARESGCQLVPGLPNDLPCTRQMHLILNDGSKKTFAILDADGDKIGTRFRIIISYFTDGSPMMACRIKVHVIHPRNFIDWHGWGLVGAGLALPAAASQQAPGTRIRSPQVVIRLKPARKIDGVNPLDCILKGHPVLCPARDKVGEGWT